MKRTTVIAAVFLAITQLSHADAGHRVVEISAKRFEFTPKQITLKKGEPVTIRLVSSDRAHGLLIKPLGIDLDAGAGDPDEITITPTVAGTFPAICDHYCGAGHGAMKMTVTVE